MLSDVAYAFLRFAIAYAIIRSVQLGVVDRGPEHRFRAALYLFFALSFLGVTP